jgi:hypothetical protein
MADSEPSGTKVAPASPGVEKFKIGKDQLSTIFDEYIKRDWCEELDFVKELGSEEDILVGL